jgi:uncharacterized protein (TIGR03067 family)
MPGHGTTLVAIPWRLLYKDKGLRFPQTRAQEKTMLRATVVILAVGVLGAPAPKKGDKEDKLEGTWIVTSLIGPGNKIDNDTLAELKLTLILKAGKYTMKVSGDTIEQGTYKSDASKNPKHLDTIASEGPQKGMVDREIYELKGDTLKTAFDEASKQTRPTSFDGEKYEVVEFTRAKE